jgi:rhodanese-related sulfurtransferase
VRAVANRYGKNKFFIIYCYGPAGRVSREASLALQQKGFSMTIYAGGIQEWLKSGFPAEGSEAAEPTAARLPAAVLFP